MKVGDLVTHGKHPGIVVEDRTSLCSIGVGKAYMTGVMMVLIEGKVERLTYSNLRLLNESRR